MTLDSSGSCACLVINGLGSYRDARAAIMRFFTLSWGTTLPKFGARLSALTGHFIFTAGPGEYGVNFATFIEKEGLGKVATLGSVTNPHYGGNHQCQVWVWQPNQKACEAWWVEANKGQAERLAKDAADLKAKMDTLRTQYGDKIFTVQTWGAHPDTADSGYGNDPTHVGHLVKPLRDYPYTPPRVYLRNGCYCDKGKMEVGKEYLILESKSGITWTLVENLKVEAPPLPPPAKMRWKIDELSGKRKYFYAADEKVE